MFARTYLRFARDSFCKPEINRSPRRYTSSSLPPSAHADNSQMAVSPSSAIDMMALVGNLKTNKRTGWILRNVQQPESIADHMYRMAFMSLMAGDAAQVDSNRCIKMAIVHDLAEAIVGDITPHCGISVEEKHAREASAIQQIKSMLGPETAAARDVESLWNEYEAGSSAEAQLVKDFDKLEMIMQAHEYEQTQGNDLEEFFQSTAGKFRTTTGRAWAAELVARRAATPAKSD